MTSFQYSDEITDMSEVLLTGTETDYSHPVFNSPGFMMYHYKVMPCQKTYRHDWRVCPYAHVGETAARRHPKLHSYVGVICPETKKGEKCPRGECCPCTHSLFEYWLHPTRFKTEFCSRGSSCSRSFCFFAHSEAELRVFDASVLSSPMARKALSIAEGFELKRFITTNDCRDATQINHQPSSALDVGLTGQTIWTMRQSDLSRAGTLCGMTPLNAKLNACGMSSVPRMAPTTPLAQPPTTLWDNRRSPSLTESGLSAAAAVAAQTLDSFGVQSKFSSCCGSDRLMPNRNYPFLSDVVTTDALTTLRMFMPPTER